MTNKLSDTSKSTHLKKEVPQFQVGDTVDVHTRIVEGDKERIQVFSGTVIMKKGAGINETFTVRRIVNNEGVERIFPLHSPFIAKVVVKRSGETPPGQALLPPRPRRQGRPPHREAQGQEGRTAAQGRQARARRRGELSSARAASPNTARRC